MTLLEAPPAIAPWPPARHTPPLSADHASIFRRYERQLRAAWVTANGYALEEWQCQLLHAITEMLPDGHLRFSEVIISMGRQNGKTEIAAALGLLFMIAKTAPLVVGIASSADQARLVYNRASKVASGYAALRRRFRKLTETRGLATITGGNWEIKAAKSGALQGNPIDLGIVDEVHLAKDALWTDLVNGTGSRYDCLVAGITTAGDDSSQLLLRLYGRDDAILGKFIWEAEEAHVPDDDSTLGLYLRQANPSVASGRTPVSRVIGDVRGMPPGEAVRYRLNRFVDGSNNGYITVAAWNLCAGPVNITRPILTIDRDPDWKFATIVATGKATDGVIEAEVVSAIAKPSIENLFAECQRLAKHSPRTFVVDRFSLGALGGKLEKAGLPVVYMNLGDEISAASMTYSKVAYKQVRHAGDAVITAQLPNVIRKTHNDTYKLARVKPEKVKGQPEKPPAPIDAVLATVRGIYVAETLEDVGIQIF